MKDLIDWEETKKHTLNWPDDMAERYLLDIETELQFNLWAVQLLRKDAEDCRNVSWGELHKLFLDGLTEAK